MAGRKRATALALVMAAALLAGCSTKAPTRLESGETAAVSATEAETEWQRVITVDGTTYKYNSRLRTVLFLGVDTHESTQTDKKGIGKGGRSDAIILMVIDPDNDTIQPYTLSRDTMTEVDVYDNDRNFVASGTMQLTMQYSFGDNAKRSCLLVKEKVSDLLLGLPIHAYCAMTLDGITLASQLMGGITLTLEEDWTDIDPSYTAGSTITMDETTLESFLRYRDTDTTGSNNVRMRRHGWFIRQMFAQMSDMSTSDVEELMEELDDYLETDLDGDMLVQLTQYQVAEEVLNVPGQTVAGRAHDEYYIDEDALQEFLLELYYIPQN